MTGLEIFAIVVLAIIALVILVLVLLTLPDFVKYLELLKMSSGRAAMIERMQALMQAENRVAPRILSTEETFADELRHRHGARALLIEARTGGDGRTRNLSVLGFARPALRDDA